MNRTEIATCDYTWNPTVGCDPEPISPGCQHCYARARASRMYPGPDTFAVRLMPKRLEQPLAVKQPSRIMLCSMGDLFAANVTPYFRQRVWNTMRQAHWHTFQVFTKRVETLLGDRLIWHPHIWSIVSIEDQHRADLRLPLLQQCSAVVRGISAEPLLGLLDLSPWLPWLDWVICGPETGPGARPMELDWARLIRDDCAKAGVPFFYKPGELDGHRETQWP